MPQFEKLDERLKLGVEFAWEMRGHLTLFRPRVELAAQLIVRVRNQRFDGDVVPIFEGRDGRALRQEGKSADLENLAGSLFFIPHLFVDDSVLHELFYRRTVGAMALDAITIENRLNLAFKGESARRTTERFDRVRRRLRREGTRRDRRRRTLRFMTSDARDRFAGERGDPTAHDLHRATFFVEGLQGDRRVRGDLEERGSVLVHGYFPQYTARIPRTVESDAVRLRAHALVGVCITEDSQSFHLAALDPLESDAFVNIRNKDVRSLRSRIDPVGDRRRTLRFAKRDRLKARLR